MAGKVPEIRIRAANAAAPRAAGTFVLYWMIAARRTRRNFALERAAGWARRLGRPLLVLEGLRCDYPWASDRLHRFVLEGMRDNSEALAGTGAAYYPYVEPRPGAGRGLLERLAADACVVVADEFPCFFHPRMVAAAAARMPVLLEQIDGNGLLPLRATERAFSTAFSFRRLLQQELPSHLGESPRVNALGRGTLPRFPGIPRDVARRWPRATPADLAEPRRLLAGLPIDHGVAPGLAPGGAEAARRALRRFVARILPGYARRRNDPDAEGTSGLSPYLHFGQLSAHEVVDAIGRAEGWTPERLARRGTGRRSGWWRMSPEAEAFLDQVVTWRELGFNFCARRDDYDRFESLPPWAIGTLRRHAADPRPHLYPAEVLEAAATHDPLWNAAQSQLVQEGRMHSYLRMLWGKKVLEWSAGPEEALAAMVHLNNKYALDGRDPNSYSGIFWCLGRYDRPWGPERPIFGTVRYMSSASAARKLRVRGYLARYAPTLPRR